MYIAINKKSTSSIVLPKVPTAAELFAAEELSRYIYEISGARIPYGNSADYKIYIAFSDSDIPCGIEAAGIIKKYEPHAEGILIYATERDLFLIGARSDARSGGGAVLYAVYEFLERFLGLSLAAYGKKSSDVGEYIEKRDTVFIAPTLYFKESADIKYRAAIVQYDNWLGNPDHPLNESFISWLAKNRYNRILTWTGIYEGYKKNGMLREAEKRGISFSVGHHEAFNTFLPPYGNSYFPERYRETHPEYYKLMEDGSRYAFREGDYSEQFTLCMRNEEMICEFSKNAVSWLSENPLVDIICLWPQDGDYPMCRCERCSRYSKSENYTYFVSAVAGRINEVFPTVKIDRIAYMDLTETPSESVSDSLLIDASVWLSSGLRFAGGERAESFADSPAEKILLSWKEKGALTVYYDYLMGIYAARQKWMPIANEIPALCKRMREVGILGLGTQIEPFNLWNNIFNFYMYGRCAYDTSLTMEDTLSRFAKIFGKSAPIIEKIIRYAETILVGNVRLDRAPEYFIRNADRDFIYKSFDEALALADTPRTRNNIRLLRMVFRYSCLEVFSPRSGEKLHEKISDATDESGELSYMRQHFDSYISENEGYGVAFPVWFKSNGNYLPDEWYDFEGE